ncbi:MAG: Hpt domain-containing protein, partial [Actinobacteria bacterium]|nr:Hpt domain-containing protein [Actinomycetota bacterium]
DGDRLASTLGRWLRPEEAEAEAAAARRRPHPDPVASAEPVGLDAEVLAALRGSEGEQFVAELVTLFVDSARERMAQLAQALASSDMSTAASAAHSLRGSSAGIGATAMAELCLRLERSASAGDVSAAAAPLPLLEAEFARVRAALAALAGAVPG